MSAPARNQTPWVVGAAGLLHLAAAVFFVRHGALNPDEGFYAAASRAVLAGELPYRDFGYTQMPLLPYINGAVMRVTGFGLFEQRAANALWGALALGLAARWVMRRATGEAAVWLTVLFTLSAPWMYFTHLGKTYAFTGFTAVLAAWVWLEWPAGAKKSAVLGLIGVLGVGCRLPGVPFFGALWLMSLGDGRRPTPAGIAGAAGVLCLMFAGLILPFYLAAPEACSFWTLEFHRASMTLRTWRLAWQEVATLAPALWFATLGAAIATLRQPSAAGRREAVLGLAALFALAGNLAPAGVYEEYAVPFLLPLGMVVAAILGRLGAGWSRLRRGAFAGALVAVHGLATPLVLWGDFPARRLTLSQWLTPNAPALNADLPGQVARARRVVEALVPPGRPLIGPHLILAVEGSRPIPPNLRMGPFSVGGDRVAPGAALLHLATPREIESYITDPAVPLLAFFQRPQLNYGWTMPEFEPLSSATGAEWLEIYRREFVIIFQEGDFLLLARPAALAAASANPPP